MRRPTFSKASRADLVSGGWLLPVKLVLERMPSPSKVHTTLNSLANLPMPISWANHLINSFCSSVKSTDTNSCFRPLYCGRLTNGPVKALSSSAVLLHWYSIVSLLERSHCLSSYAIEEFSPSYHFSRRNTLAQRPIRIKQKDRPKSGLL